MGQRSDSSYLKKMEPTKKIEILERALEREKKARKLAEKILEEKSTELYDLSEALRQSNNRLKELLKEKTSQLEGVFVNIIDAYIIMDIQGNVLKMNQAAKDMLGYDNEKEVVNLLKLVHSDYVEYTAAAFFPNARRDIWGCEAGRCIHKTNTR